MSTPERTLVTEASADETYIRKDADPNSILVGGIPYRTSGAIALSPMDITTASEGMYWSDIFSISVPEPPPTYGYAVVPVNLLNARGADLIPYGNSDSTTLRFRWRHIASRAASTWYGVCAVRWILVSNKT